MRGEPSTEGAPVPAPMWQEMPPDRSWHPDAWGWACPLLVEADGFTQGPASLAPDAPYTEHQSPRRRVEELSGDDPDGRRRSHLAERIIQRREGPRTRPPGTVHGQTRSRPWGWLLWVLTWEGSAGLPRSLHESPRWDETVFLSHIT